MSVATKAFVHRPIGVGLALALGACLSPVDRAGRSPADAGPGTACTSASDCPQPAFPLAAACVDGVCTAIDLCAAGGREPCTTASDCRCPSPLDCIGSFACVQGTCEFKCGRSCASDFDCATGMVCEPDVGCTTGRNVCVAGCHTAEQCGPGYSCAVADCKTCPCPGVCVANGTCTTNADCPAGLACGEDTKCQRACVPGCRSSEECEGSEICAPRDCRACGCRTPICQQGASCVEDDDCPEKTLCGLDLQCERRCVPGCRSTSDCDPGESCEPQPCSNCTCSRPKCTPLAACAADRDCPSGSVCEAAPSCTSPKRCLPGCHTSAQCGAGETCAIGPCRDCPCVGTCTRDVVLCAEDEDCPSGEVCEPGAGCVGDLRCVPGCHHDGQCADGERCDESARCVTCPCPGTCTFDPCVDKDGDGYAWACRNAPPCPGLLGDCDCDDHNRAVHPRAAEICGNLRDDDCNGLLDDGCGCPAGACRDDRDCNLGVSYCGANACCAACPIGTPNCGAGECLTSPKADLHACTGTGSCGSCCTCPTVEDPVCGTDYASYGNGCEASCQSAAVLHHGVCARGEGLACSPTSSAPCPAGQYCRDPCPPCASMHPFRCTKLGACAGPADCPGGLTPPSCPRGPGSWACVDSTCTFSCP